MARKSKNKKSSNHTGLIIALILLVLLSFGNDDADTADNSNISKDVGVVEQVEEPVETEVPDTTEAPAATETPDETETPASPKPTVTVAPTKNVTSKKENTSSKKNKHKNPSFEIYFIDVGQGDAALVTCNGHSMLIDGGNNKESSLIYSFLKSHDISHLDYIVASHPDADHIGGLAGALNYATVDTAFCTTTQHDTKTFQNFVKYLNEQDKEITVPDAGDSFSLGKAECTILYPEKGQTRSDNTSIVLRIVYGDTSFLFTGDSMNNDEKDMLNSGYPIKSTVLKVAHHGSNSSSSYQFLYYVEPKYAVISVGGKNSYGHPTENVLSRLRDADVETFRTDMQGDIHCTSDGKTVSFDVEKNASIDTFTAAGGYANWLAAKVNLTL